MSSNEDFCSIVDETEKDPVKEGMLHLIILGRADNDPFLDADTKVLFQEAADQINKDGKVSPESLDKLKLKICKKPL